MDNTQPNQQAAAQQPSENKATVQPEVQTSTKNKPPLFLFLLIGLIIIFGAAIFLIQNKDLLGLPMNQTNNQVNTQISPTSTVSSLISPTTASTSSPEVQEVENINVDEAVDADFREVDKDIQELQGS